MAAASMCCTTPRPHTVALLLSMMSPALPPNAPQDRFAHPLCAHRRHSHAGLWYCGPAMSRWADSSIKSSPG